MSVKTFHCESLPCTLVKGRKASHSSPERFSLLLLEFGEIYFEDFSVICYPNVAAAQEAIERKQRGRLKMCTESLIFDPLNGTDPVIKIAFRDCVKIVKWDEKRNTHLRTGGNGFLVEANQVTEMLERNIITPYKFRKQRCRFLFTLNYGSIESVLSQLRTLHEATRLPRADKHSLFKGLVAARRFAVSFNISWLEDLYEEVVCELSGERVTPLVSNPGRIMLTSSRIYFQPYNNVEVDPVLKMKLSELRYVMKRRYMLRHVGIELFSASGSSMFLVVRSPKERNYLYDHLVKLQPDTKLQIEDLPELTFQWQTGGMSNYDYLMLLNFLADRSFIDIMQYPVMPWIVADYTSTELDLKGPATFRDLSKPIGALNEERLAFFQERYSEMSGKKFLYGTHYSAPGYVLYFLVRAAPEYLLCLQNGNFDKPNRLFHSVAKTWDNVNTDHADVKELIPEFYRPPGDFLTNQLNLDLGVRTDGMRVNNVVLPPWAKDATDFTRQLREALECDFVSERLHNWIDLIFGYKQTGEDAVRANNVFHYLTYEGAFNLDRINDPEELAATELQIKEFGQTPTQLFHKPHPPRLTVGLPEVVPFEEVKTVGGSTEGLVNCWAQQAREEVDGVGSDSEWVTIEMPREMEQECTNGDGGCIAASSNLKLEYTQKVHKEPISAVRLSHDGKTIFSVSHDKTLKAHQIEDRQLFRSSSVSNLPLSSLSVLPDSRTVLVGSWDNNIHIYSVEFASVVDSLYCHHSSVTCVCWKHNILATGSWDSTVKIWELKFLADQESYSEQSPELLCELDHDNEVSCLDIDNKVTRVVTGTVDGFVTVWNIPYGERELELQAHSETVHAVLFSPDGGQVCSCGGDGVVKLTDLSTHVESLSKKSNEPIHCVAWVGDKLLLGTGSGEVLLWEASTFAELAKIKGHSNSVTSVDVSNDGKTVVSGSRDKCIGIWSLH